MKKTLVLLVVFSTLSLFLAGNSQEAVLKPGDNLIVEGIPAIPAALADDVALYNNFRSASFQDWHPLKREMIISTRFADASQAHLVKMPGGARTQLTFYKERVSSPSYDPINGDFIVFAKDVGGNENFQLYRFDFASGKTTLLTDGLSRNIGGVWSNKGDRLAYESNRRDKNDMDIRVIDPREPGSDLLLLQVQGGAWGALDWSPDDGRLLVQEGISINESYLWLLDMASGKKELLTPKGKKEKIAYNYAAFSSDGKGIYALTDKDSEFVRLAYIDLASRKHTYLTGAIPWDIDEFALSRDRGRIAFISNEEGVAVLHVRDLAAGKDLPLPALPMGMITGLQWHRDGKTIGFTYLSPRANTDAYSLDIENNEIERWTTSELGGLNSETFALPELIKWKSFDQKTIVGFLYRPAARFSGKRPVIIDIHGGPEGQARPLFIGQENYFLNELGVALIFPNVRGSSGFGKTFLKLDNGFLREGTYKDIAALLDWIKTQPDLDSERVMVTGGSYGGHMTLAIAAFYPERIRCAVEVVGISNLVTFLENTSGYRQDLRRVEYGDERDPKMRRFMLKIAPLNNSGKISKPLFIIQGANDPRVPLSEAEQMRDTLKKGGVPVWYLVAKDEGHGFAKKGNRDFQFYATVLFIKEFLLK
ncbi:MAG: S9 family peptidase [Candidatus Aminicenantes bacterium]|nr:S9 family peptidase [Candidatus Aminicenantes bacterium]